MHLFYANEGIEDVIDGIELEGYAATSNGMLTVTYILTRPPEEWEGLRGKINIRVLSSWLAHHMRREMFSNIGMTSPMSREFSSVNEFVPDTAPPSQDGESHLDERGHAHRDDADYPVDHEVVPLG